MKNSFKKIPVFCINLKRAKERKERMLQEWTEKRGVELIFFDGVYETGLLCKHAELFALLVWVAAIS